MSSPVFTLLKRQNRRSSSGSIMGDSTGPQSLSLCVVLRYRTTEPLFCSIVQLDPVTPEMIKNPRKRINAKWIAHFWRPHNEETLKAEPLPWVFSTPTSSNDDLYLLPDLPLSDPETHHLYGAAFNCSTRSFQPIEQPHSYKFGGVAVTVQHNIYFIAHPSSYVYLEDTPGVDVFERYNPATQLWVQQVPLPISRLSKFADDCQIKASAVWDDTILLNIAGCEIWAYHVYYCEWYRVNVHEDKGGCLGSNRCLDIEGEAFIVGNTLYALSQVHFDRVVALSIKKEGVGRDLEYSCAFLSELILKPMERYRENDTFYRSRYFFPLDKDLLCFVRSSRCMDSVKTQPIQVSYIKLMEDGKMTVTVEYCYWVPLVDRQQFDIGSCFSLPDGKTTALKPCETFNFDPILGTASPGIPVQEKEDVPRPKRGRTVIVINLPLDATAKQLEKIMKKFGHLERDRIQLIRDAAGKHCCAFVEFESAASRRRATEASPIIIGGYRSEILKLQGTSLAKVGSKNRKRRVIRLDQQRM